MIEPTPAALRDLLTRVPTPQVAPDPQVARAIDRSLEYLGSDAALASIERDPYWPKWDSPWWHILLLEEIGEVRRVPARTLERLVDRMNRMPIHVFPIDPGDAPPGTDRHRDTTCHCALGCLCRALSGFGLDFDAALPWASPWFVRYQMADGGLNCDGDAYLQTDECPSSMVATIAPFEAMLAGDATAWSPERRMFLARAAAFLIDRRLVLGSPTRHNASERVSAARWRASCFPRFYFYDALRGLQALVRWAERTGGALPVAAVSPVVQHLVARCPDGVVRREREAVEGVTTHARASDGRAVRQPASRFPLLDATSVVGQACPYATGAWTTSRQALLGLIDRGLLTA